MRLALGEVFRNVKVIFLRFLPIILIVFIIEGTFAGISGVFLLCFIIYKIYIGVKAADEVGLIDRIGEQMFKKK